MAEGQSHLHDGVQDQDQVLPHAVAAEGVVVVVVVAAAAVVAAAVAASCIEVVAVAYDAEECVVERVEQIVDHQGYGVEMVAENPQGSWVMGYCLAYQ